MPDVVDVTIIGGGIMGLAVADSWLNRQPRARVLVLEKEDQLGQHASGRNSGVLHAGFYYAPDSLKARLTRDGNAMLRQFCNEVGVPIRATGKVVVAQSEDQLPGLDELMKRGVANGVELEMLDESMLAEVEPFARTCQRAIWSPTTAVADPRRVVEALAQRVRERGGRIEVGSTVTAARAGHVARTGGDDVTTGHIVNAAGLYADRVAHWFGVGTEYRMLPFKGLYWYGDWPAGRLSRHVYPVPDPRNPFLGVHLTVTVNGQVKVGPTAIPALWREDYGHLETFRLDEAREIALSYPAFIRSKHHDVLALIRSELPKYSRSHLVNAARSLVPSVDPRSFTVRGKPGVRAQLFDIGRRRLEMDFVVRDGSGSTHILNAVSPAWTSALAVAEYVLDRIQSGGDRLSTNTA